MAKDDGNKLKEGVEVMVSMTDGSKDKKATVVEDTGDTVKIQYADSQRETVVSKSKVKKYLAE